MTKKTNELTHRIITRAAIVASALAFVLPLGAHAALLTQQLELGDSNSDVTSLQVFLSGNSSIYPEGIISGYFGQLTGAAVSRFQVENHLPAVGRVGPATLALINSQMGGVSTPSGDISAPIIYPESVSLGTNSATISWATNEASRGRAMYGTSWPFLYATAPSVTTASFGSTSGVTLSGLQPHTTYYYVLESIDAAGNIMWTTKKPLITQ